MVEIPNPNLCKRICLNFLHSPATETKKLFQYKHIFFVQIEDFMVFAVRVYPMRKQNHIEKLMLY